ncbi:MAG TPA: cytochrome c biogenesis protein CcsA, partial [Abditibacteriaceae bacterium]
VPMAITMIVAFMMSAWHGVGWLRKREVRSDALSLSFAEAGFACGLIATATGSVWARVNWGQYWSWDPQQVGIVALLLTYAAIFALRGAVDDEDKVRNLWAVYALFGLLSAIFWTVIFRRLMPSLHPNDTLIKSEKWYRLVLWFNVFGYVAVMIKLATLRARIEIAAHKLKEKEWNTF